MESCGCQTLLELDVGASPVSSVPWGLLPARGAGVAGKKFGVLVFNLLPSERISWPPAAFFPVVWFKKMPFF